MISKRIMPLSNLKILDTTQVSNSLPSRSGRIERAITRDACGFSCSIFRRPCLQKKLSGEMEVEERICPSQTGQSTREILHEMKSTRWPKIVYWFPALLILAGFFWWNRLPTVFTFPEIQAMTLTLYESRFVNTEHKVQYRLFEEEFGKVEQVFSIENTVSQRYSFPMTHVLVITRRNGKYFRESIVFHKDGRVIQYYVQKLQASLPPW